MGWSDINTVGAPKLIKKIYLGDVQLPGMLETASAAGAIAATLLLGQVKHLRHKRVLAPPAVGRDH